jgi:two-component system, OmpR family, phosphate regulon sensor histidine kinase PhoR
VKFKFRTPANVLFRRAQLILMLVVLIPTVLMTSLGITMLAMGTSSFGVVAGILVVSFCASSITGYMIGSMLLSRGASLAKVQTDFLSSVSHELMTPITSVRMFIDTLREDRVTDAAERHKCLTIVSKEMERLEQLVSKLLALSKIESGRQPFEQVGIPVERLVEDALDALGALTLGKPSSVQVEVEPGLSVVGDRPSLVQVLTNLLSNAWKYTPPDDKKIAITARAAGPKQVEIAVSDNGPGVPEAERRRIWEEFERGSAASSSRAEGRGLGLSIVRAIVRAHRGRVELQPAGSRGSCFRVFLPRLSGAPT